MKVKEIIEILEKPRFATRKTYWIKALFTIDLKDYIIVETDDELEKYKFKIIDIKDKSLFFNTIGVSTLKEALAICLDEMCKTDNIFYNITRLTDK